MQRSRWVFLSMAAAFLAGCGGGNDAAGGAVRAPASSGKVLVMDNGGRNTAPAAVLGFVHGVHTFVLDGDRVFAGMTPVKAAPGENGARTLTFDDGVTAQLIPTQSGFELRFASGESIALREQEQAQ